MKPLLEVENIKKTFWVGGSSSGGGSSLLNRLRQNDESEGFLYALDDVCFRISPGEKVGLVGESGCGKSTLVRLITRLIDPTSGRIKFRDEDIGSIPAGKFVKDPMRKQIQVVFQDPTESLNPAHPVFRTIADPLLRLGGKTKKAALKERVEELANMVGLPEELLSRYPHQLSGGQKARVGIARAIALEPSLLILDEPTSSLDVSVQAVILHLLNDLKERLGMSYLFVSHDLNVVRLLCDRVLVMYLGKIVESGPVEDIFSRPKHPYTRALLSAIPNIEPKKDGTRLRISGEPMSPIDPSPSVCRFYGRCPKGVDHCETEIPLLREHPNQVEVACHYPESYSEGEFVSVDGIGTN